MTKVKIMKMKQNRYFSMKLFKSDTITFFIEKY